MKYQDNKEYCPHCNADLQGKSIPKDQQHLFGATHFSRRIGLYSMETDRTEEYKCPDCDGRWKAKP